MPEPITLAVLGTIAATEGIKFLFGQASDLIKAYRERRKAAEAGEELPATLEVPLQTPEVLDRAPEQTPADTQVVAANAKEMNQLISGLSAYAEDRDDVSLDDEELARQAGRLRELLEAAYGQRLTFKGEKREPTGTIVRVSMDLGTVEGTATGIEELSGTGDFSVDQKAERVTGSITGIKKVQGG
jgi:hypothetical protein